MLRSWDKAPESDSTVSADEGRMSSESESSELSSIVIICTGLWTVFVPIPVEEETKEDDDVLGMVTAMVAGSTTVPGSEAFPFPLSGEDFRTFC